MTALLTKPVKPDWEAFLRCLRREGTPRRVHVIELYLDKEVRDEVAARFDLSDGLSKDDPDFHLKREIRIQRFLGYDYVRCSVDDINMQIHRKPAQDTACLKRSGGRMFVDEKRGPITSWAEFEAYPWPDPETFTTRALQWYEAHLPDDMCIVGSGQFAHFAEWLTWLMGYETLCYSLFDQRNLVEAISRRLLEIYEAMVARLLEFDRVKVLWGSDDMGFRSGTLISPDDLRTLVLPGHRAMAQAAHAAGRPYLLHSCGKIEAIMPDLVNVVGIDGIHSFEDAITTVEEAKTAWGRRIAILGGLDMDFLCRSDEAAIRSRVRRTLDACLPGGGYCLGTGNSVANYIPLQNYLVMLDEGRRYAV